MFNVSVEDTAVRAWLSQMPQAVHDRLLQAVYGLAEKLRTHVVKDKLMGQVLNRRSGRLAQSIQQKVDQSSTTVTGTVYSAGDVKYAAIHEFGGRTAAHVIEAKTAQSLMFRVGGKTVFARRVNHPGSQMPQRSFMRSSLGDMRTEIIDRMSQAVGEGTKQ